VTGDRLAVAADGRVVLRLRHPWADGTTHVAFEPTAFLDRLAVLACPRCGGRLRLVALLEAGPVTARILRHLGLPAARPARAPPIASGDESW